MGYRTIIIDLEELKDIKSGLDFVYEEMSNITDIAKNIEGLIGDPEPDLKGAVNSFQSSWDDNRKDILDAAKKMADGTQKVIDDWTQWDTDTANKLSSQGAPAASSTSGGAH
jgi:hypothetical protein